MSVGTIMMPNGAQEAGTHIPRPPAGRSHALVLQLSGKLEDPGSAAGFQAAVCCHLVDLTNLGVVFVLHVSACLCCFCADLGLVWFVSAVSLLPAPPTVAL